MNRSEVSQIRQRIDLEIASMNQTKRGYAIVSSHEVITHHLEILGLYLEQLTSQIGEEAAVKILAEQMERGV